MLGNINLQDELLRHRNRLHSEKAILDAVHQILDENEKKRSEISDTLATGESVDFNNWNIDLLDSDRIFHISHIRSMCITYRLRFLDSALFKYGVPAEAISKIDRLNSEHCTKLQGFKIMAPSNAFKLKNYDDPILFAPIGNQYYYLIHKWGNDFSTTRKWIVYPFKNLLNFTVFCVLLSLVLTWLTPIGVLGQQLPLASVIVFLFMFKSVFAVALYAFYMLGYKLNDVQWDSKYFN